MGPGGPPSTDKPPDKDGNWNKVSHNKRKRTNSENGSESENNQVNYNKSKKYKIPPIIVNQTITDVNKFTSNITNLCKSPVYFKYVKKMSIYASSKEDHSSILTNLTLLEVAHHTFTLPDQRPIHVVLRGLPSVEITKLQQNIEIHNIKPKRIIQMTKKKISEDQTVTHTQQRGLD